jgi:hypothetical protein
MQTFLPYDDFEKSALCLDYRRLGKQRVEAWQIYNTLVGNSTGWRNHPAVKMWAGYEDALLLYGLVMCSVWKSRGYKDTLWEKFNAEIVKRAPVTIVYPSWFGNPAFHDSHKSNLMRKNKEYYSLYFGDFVDDLPYMWPNKTA